MKVLAITLNVIHKFVWRLGRLIRSAPAAFAAAATEPSAHPWRFMLAYHLNGDVSRRMRSSKYLRRGYIPGLLMTGSQVRIGNAGAVIDLQDSNVTEGLLNGIIMQYLDVWYPSVTRYPVPFFIGEGPYELGLCKMGDGDVVIDAGANFGIFTWIAAERIGPSGKVLAFEPSSSCANLIKQSVKSSKIGDRVVLVQQGLAANEAVTTFTAEDLSAGNVPASGDSSTEVEQVRLTSLDHYAAVNRLPSVDFIKADIEGMEVDLLIGAEQVIRNYKPRVSICTYHAANHRQLLTEILLSYRPDYEIVYSDAKLHAW